jgi:hypothetical protein
MRTCHLSNSELNLIQFQSVALLNNHRITPPLHHTSIFLQTTSDMEITMAKPWLLQDIRHNLCNKILCLLDRKE